MERTRVETITYVISRDEVIDLLIRHAQGKDGRCLLPGAQIITLSEDGAVFTYCYPIKEDAPRKPESKPVFCKNCPFAQHVHYEENGKLIAPGCSGFEAAHADRSKP
jgi:hypothetical protein